jgi:hypothetical protein
MKVYQMLKVRASSSAPLFSGEDGLTDKQAEQLEGLLSKIKLTELQAKTRDELIVKRDAEPTLSAGGKTLVEEYVEQELYDFRPTFGSRETDKGNMVEDDAISFYNDFFMTSYKKFDDTEELSYGIYTGHPDIVSKGKRKVIDIKSPWSKKTFPKTADDGKNSTYEWQVKQYLYMLGKITGEDWRTGEIAYVLMSTPESLLSEWDDDSMHYVDNLPENFRITIVPVELTDKDIAKFEAREKVAIKYYEEYKQVILNKNK